MVIKFKFWRMGYNAWGVSAPNKKNGLSRNKAYAKYHSFHILPVLETPHPKYRKTITMKFDALSAKILCTKSNFSSFYLPVFFYPGNFSFQIGFKIKVPS
jgi:hypothetical protein